MNPHSHLKVARIVAKLLDSQFSFFGRKFGLDPIISSIPVIGDFIGLIFSLYIVWIGFQMGLPFSKVGTMLSRAVFDFLIGSIPVLGFFADFVYGANMKNLNTIEEHLSSFVYGEVVE